MFYERNRRASEAEDALLRSLERDRRLRLCIPGVSSAPLRVVSVSAVFVGFRWTYFSYEEAVIKTERNETREKTEVKVREETNKYGTSSKLWRLYNKSNKNKNNTTINVKNSWQLSASSAWWRITNVRMSSTVVTRRDGENISRVSLFLSSRFLRLWSLLLIHDAAGNADH